MLLVTIANHLLMRPELALCLSVMAPLGAVGANFMKVCPFMEYATSWSVFLAAQISATASLAATEMGSL
jgi:hypothetical protein